MSRPSTLYDPHILNAGDIHPEERFSQIPHNLSDYDIDVANNRRPEDIIAHHKTAASGVMGDDCSAFGSRNETIFPPIEHKTLQSIFPLLFRDSSRLIVGKNRSIQVGEDTGLMLIRTFSLCMTADIASY